MIYTIGVRNDTIYNGPLMIFYENGQINTFDTYFDNKKEGISLHYNESGILTRKSFYRNNVKDGEQYYFDYETGDTLLVEFYKEGILIKSDSI